MQTFTGTGRYFDGLSARPVSVSLRLAAGRLEVLGPGLRRDWSCLDLRAAEALRPMMRVGPAGVPERVEFSDEGLARALDGLCPDLAAGPAREGGTLRLILWSAAAGASLLLLAVFGMPALAGILAPLVPESTENRLGAAVEEQVVSLLGKPPVCDAPAGRAALDRMVTALARAGTLPADLRVSVRRARTENALTLPGARVVVLSGLIAKARSPDELAGVLAHEFGHVSVRDPTRALIQSSGTAFLLSYVLGDLTGSTVIVAVGQAVLAAGYSRDAERAADAYSVRAMAGAGADGAALAAILERIAGDDGDAVAFLRSHPATRERAAAIRAQARALDARSPIRGPILDAKDWAALKAICPRPDAAEPRPGREPEAAGPEPMQDL